MVVVAVLVDGGSGVWYTVIIDWLVFCLQQLGWKGI